MAVFISFGCLALSPMYTVTAEHLTMPQGASVGLQFKWMTHMKATKPGQRETKTSPHNPFPKMLSKSSRQKSQSYEVSLPDSSPLQKMPKINITRHMQVKCCRWRCQIQSKVLPTQCPEDEQLEQRKDLSTEDSEDSCSHLRNTSKPWPKAWDD